MMPMTTLSHSLILRLRSPPGRRRSGGGVHFDLTVTLLTGRRSSSGRRPVSDQLRDTRSGWDDTARNAVQLRRSRFHLRRVVYAPPEVG